MSRKGEQIFFTQRVVVVLDQAWSSALGSKCAFVGTGHFLEGMLLEGNGVAGRTLKSLGVDLDLVRRSVRVLVESGSPIINKLGYTVRAEAVLKMAKDEAMEQGLTQAGTGQVLSAMIAIREGTAWGILDCMGLDFDKLRTELTTRMRQANLDESERLGE